MIADGRKIPSAMRYAEWAEEAMRAVVVRALEQAAQEGIPEEHSFLLTFRTNAEGVSLPRFLKARYRDSMTIELGRFYSDLFVDHQTRAFSVMLSFDGVPAGIVVPFAAIASFEDRKAHYVLHFSEPTVETAAMQNLAAPPVTQAPGPHPGEPAVSEEPRGQVLSLAEFRLKMAHGKSR